MSRVHGFRVKVYGSGVSGCARVEGSFPISMNPNADMRRFTARKASKREIGAAVALTTFLLALHAAGWPRMFGSGFAGFQGLRVYVFRVLSYGSFVDNHHTTCGAGLLKLAGKERWRSSGDGCLSLWSRMYLDACAVVH